MPDEGAPWYAPDSTSLWIGACPDPLWRLLHRMCIDGGHRFRHGLRGRGVLRPVVLGTGTRPPAPSGDRTAPPFPPSARCQATRGEAPHSPAAHRPAACRSTPDTAPVVIPFGRLFHGRHVLQRTPDNPGRRWRRTRQNLLSPGTDCLVRQRPHRSEPTGAIPFSSQPPSLGLSPILPHPFSFVLSSSSRGNAALPIRAFHEARCRGSRCRCFAPRSA